MKKSFPLRIFKTLRFMLLIFVLVVSSCGVKQSIQQVFNIENSSSTGSKSTSSCQFVSTQISEKSEQVAVKRIDYSIQKVTFLNQISISKADQIGIHKARSVPLYILYQQLRTSLV